MNFEKKYGFPFFDKYRGIFRSAVWHLEPNSGRGRSKKVFMREKTLLTLDVLHLSKNEEGFSIPNPFNNRTS